MAPPPYPFQILSTLDQVRQWVSQRHSTAQTIGFVPTMGCLHPGHLELVTHSLSATDETIVSIFINPTQFGPQDDFDIYPKTIRADLEALSQLSVLPGSRSMPTNFDGSHLDRINKTILEPTQPDHHLRPRTVSAVFLPTQEVMYPNGVDPSTIVDVRSMSNILEGSIRTGLFRGIATIALKLINLVEPDYLFLGQKDLHQALLIRRMISDLHLRLPHAIVIVPTVRDTKATNLALSSRNRYLTQDELDGSGCLIDALFEAGDYISKPDRTSTSLEALREMIERSIDRRSSSSGFSGPKIRLEFFSINDPIRFEPLTEVRPEEPVALSGAILVGDRPVRLTDNLVLRHDLNSGLVYPNIKSSNSHIPTHPL